MDRNCSSPVTKSTLFIWRRVCRLLGGASTCAQPFTCWMAFTHLRARCDAQTDMQTRTHHEDALRRTIARPSSSPGTAIPRIPATRQCQGRRGEGQRQEWHAIFEHDTAEPADNMLNIEWQAGQYPTRNGVHKDQEGCSAIPSGPGCS